MTRSQPTPAAYEIDRIEQSQSIVVKHIEDKSSAQPLLWGLVSYVTLLPVMISALLFIQLF